MYKLIQARLDRDTEEIVKEFTKSFGWSESEVVREGIKCAAQLLLVRNKRKLVGVGKFSSDIPDLATNKKHLDGYGK